MRRAIICTTMGLALATGCMTAGPERAGDRPSPSSTTTPAADVAAHQVPAEETRGIRVEPDGTHTTITTVDGEHHRLAGRFTFDALSTRGDRLYLIEHRPPTGSENYRVRLFDLRTGKLHPQPIADKRNLQTDMTGAPKARAVTDSGEWVFTLYRGARHAFVHALNVDEAYALCLDLPHGSGAGDGAWSLTLSRDDSLLRAVAGSPDDAATFKLREVLGEQ